MLAKKRQEYGQRVADLPGIYKQYTPESDREISALRSQQSDKLKQLFDFDSQVAQRTYQPIESAGPYSQGYTPPEPRVLDPTIGLLASSYQKKATAGELADISTDIARRKDYLSGERDKALTMLQAVLDANEKEQRGLEKQMDWYFKQKDYELEERKLKEGGSGASDLMTFLNAISGFQQKTEAIKPIAFGITKADPFKLIEKKGGFARRNPKTGLLEPAAKAGPNYRALINELNKYPGAEFDFQKNPDGTYGWAVRKPEQQFFESEEEAQRYQDIPSLIRQLGAATVAGGATPSDVNTMLNLLGMQAPAAPSEAEKKLTAKRELLDDISKEAETNLDLVFRKLRPLYPELTAEEIMNELQLSGKFVKK